MTKPSLQVVENDYLYQIQWFFPDEDDFGAALGESTYKDDDLEGCERDDRDHVVASLVAAKSEGVQRRGTRGYYWETRSQAVSTLRAIRSAIKADRVSASRPWPDWAVKAAAEGWKAPKGWTP